MTAGASDAMRAAEVANSEAVRLTLAIQQLHDAVKRGQTITEHDLQTLHVDCRVLSVAVARTYHAVSRISTDRRAEVA